MPRMRGCYRGEGGWSRAAALGGALAALALGSPQAIASETEAPVPVGEGAQPDEAGVAPSASAEPNQGTKLEPGTQGVFDGAPPSPVPSRLESPPIALARPLPREADLLARARLRDGRLVAHDRDGARVLTVAPRLQGQLGAIMASYQTPYAAAVVLEPKTGRVLALAEHSAAEPELTGLPVKAVFPAASIFKVVTAAALLEQGLGPDDESCSFGGKRKVGASHLEDTAQDHLCLTLSDALAQSANGVFAKLTARHLSPEQLQATAGAFGFNRPIPFELPLDVSLAAFPEEPLPFAQTGAGFGDVYLSPLHGALIAAITANRGLFVAPTLFEDQVGQAEPVRALSEELAEQLSEMMVATVTRGTARRIFRERGFRVAGAAGKTGSLADKRPFRDYSWFVGFAPKEDPQVAVAAVIVNDPQWRIRATWLGREALRLGLAALPPSSGELASSAKLDQP
jgi:penicillin-binding protein A